LQLPTELAPGDYALVAAFRTEEGVRLPLATTDTGTTASLTAQEWVITTLHVQQPSVIVTHNALWQAARIEAVAHSDQAIAGTSLFVDVTAAQLENQPLKLSLRLVNGAGEVVAQNDQVFAPTVRFRLPIAADASPGRYQLVAVLYEPETLAPLPTQDGDFILELSPVEIE
jgi:hypothetical protein